MDKETNKMKKLGVFTLALLVSACASQSSKDDTSQKLGAAVTAPLNDLNFVQTAIPEQLRAAQKNPYAVPVDASCTGLAKEISALDEVLGADLDTPIVEKDESLIARNIMSESVSALRKTTEAVVPYRNWIRKLSGAERNSRAVAASISAGGIRRAYLKGVGQASKCQSPAAPKAIAASNNL
jgi:hypothetical protein